MQRLLMKFPLVVILSSAVCFAGDYEDGTAAFDRGDYAIALKKLHPLAEQGNALAQNSLGLMYVEGKGVSQDYDEAIRWFRKAADQGLAKAQTNLGWMYVEGESVSQDYAEAAKCFAKRRTRDSRWRNTI
jgi:TPR repeat protein